ncbi:hypothetical protein Q8A67_001522 [Cirrhinus molitorella]|uniref:Helicase ATP-binding domain-containing protein n=1 Tax=Cirrhinus molitorella TaxID=172907 RepID=A0AA88QHC9_9TELE|nr:hypothetical protein Q8A67_001522 [Cirrhinus molitorella]
MDVSEANPIVVIVSPLLALMEDQIKEAEKLGVTAGQLGVHDERDILEGRFSLAFGSPESWLLNSKWRRMLTSSVYQQNIIGVVVDEVHVFSIMRQNISFTLFKVELNLLLFSISSV